MPKIHAFDHCVHRMEVDCVQKGYILNPLIHAVQIDEDYVGCISRTARRTGVGQVIECVLKSFGVRQMALCARRVLERLA